MSTEPGTEVSSCGPPIRWVKSYFNEESFGGPLIRGLDSWGSTWFYEVTASDDIVRVIELVGSGQVPVAAASQFELDQLGPFDENQMAWTEYERTFGQLPEGPAADWAPDPKDEPISREEFERQWERARRLLERNPRWTLFADRGDGQP